MPPTAAAGGAAGERRTVYRLRKASITTASSSDEEEDKVGSLKGRIMSNRYRIASEGGESQHGAPARSDSSVSLSTERHIMKDQLQHVKQQLNVLTGAFVGGPGGSSHSQGALGAPRTSVPIAAPVATSVLPGQVPVLEKLLQDIVARLSSIESMYDGVTGRLTRVDHLAHRAAETERNVRELQHISAGAIHETARLVDIVGTGRGPPPHSSSAGLGPLPTTPLAGRPPRAARISGSPGLLGLLDSLPPPQVTSIIHQHASQIHKLIAGLDFLEQHIMRQDQAIDTLQTLSRSAGGGQAPNELSLKLHDLTELVAKLRAHLYKLEKKVGSADATLGQVADQVTALAAKVDSQGRGLSGAGRNNHDSSVGTLTDNPLYAGAEDSAAPEGDDHTDLPTRVAEVGHGLTAIARQVTRLEKAPPDEIQALRAEVAELRAALAAQQQAAAAAQTDVAALRAQLKHATDSLQVELATLRVPVPALRQPVSRATSITLPSDITPPLDVPAVLEQVHVNLEQLTDKVSGVGERLAVVDALVAAARTRQDGTDAHLAEVEAAVQQVKEEGSTVARVAAREAAAVVSTDLMRAQLRLGELNDALTEARERLNGLAASVAADMATRVSLATADQVSELVARVETADAQVAALRALLVGCNAEQQQLAAKTAHLEATQAESLGTLTVSLNQARAEAAAAATCVREELQALEERLQAPLEGTAAAIVALGARVDGIAEDADAVHHAIDAAHRQLEGTVRAGDLETLRQQAAAAQAAAAEALAGLASLRGVLASDYINHEKLGAIFAAREDMRAAVAKLEGVFAPRQVLSIVTGAVGTPLQAAPVAAASSALGSAAVDPAISEEVAALASKVAALQAQLQLVQYRTESMVRQEELGSMKQGIVALEMQLREHAKRSVPVTAASAAIVPVPPGYESIVGAAAVAGPAAVRDTASARRSDAANPDQVAERIRAVEAQVASLREFAAAAQPVVSEQVPDLTRSVQDLQLLLFDLRGQRLEGGGKAAAQTTAQQVVLPDADDVTDFAATEEQGAGRGALAATLRMYHSFAAPDGLPALDDEADEVDPDREPELPRSAPPDLLPAFAQLQERVEALEKSGLATVPEAADLRADVHTLSQGLQELKAQLLKVQPGPDLELRVVSLETAVAAAAQSVAAAPLAAAELSVQVGALSTGLAQLKTHVQDGVASTALLSRVERFEKAVAAQADSTPAPVSTSTTEGSALTARIQALTTALGDLQKQVQAVQTDSKATSAAAAAQHTEHVRSLGAAIVQLAEQVHDLRASATASGAGEQRPVVLRVVLRGSDGGDTIIMPLAIRDPAPVDTLSEALTALSSRLEALERSSASIAAAANALPQDQVAQLWEAIGGLRLALARPDTHGAASFGPSALHALPSSTLGHMGSAIRSQDSFTSLSAMDWGTAPASARDRSRSPGHGSISSPTAMAGAALSFSRGSGGAGSGQPRLLAKLLEVVRRQSDRLHAQYADETEIEGQLAQVDQTLEAVQQQLDASGPSAADTYAEAMVAILDQVAALRTIGSQTHPAIPQMLLAHDSQLQELEDKVKAMLGQDGAKVAGTVPPATTRASSDAALNKLEARVEKVEQGYQRLHDGQGALSKALRVLSTGQLSFEGEEAGDIVLPGPGSGVRLSTGGGATALRAVAAKVAQLEDIITHTISANTAESGDGGAAAAEAAAADDAQAAANAEALTTLQGKLVEYGRVLQAMRNRVVALQEYVDSTQGMVKELHTVHGSVLMRLSALESSETSMPDSIGQVQADLQSLESKFLAFSASQVALSSSLEALSSVGDRLAELDARDGEFTTKLASITQTMPAIASQLKTLERTLQSRLDACCSQLKGLAAVLAEISRLEKEDSKNPFAGLGAAGNPVVKLLEAKVEMLRSALANVAAALAVEFNKPQHP